VENEEIAARPPSELHQMIGCGQPRLAGADHHDIDFDRRHDGTHEQLLRFESVERSYRTPSFRSSTRHSRRKTLTETAAVAGKQLGDLARSRKIMPEFRISNPENFFNTQTVERDRHAKIGNGGEGGILSQIAAKSLNSGQSANRSGMQVGTGL